MGIFEDIIGGFGTLFSDQFAIYFVVLAAFVGIVFGALPGLTAAAAIAMMLPILIAYNDEIGGLAGLAVLQGDAGGSQRVASVAPREDRHRLPGQADAIPPVMNTHRAPALRRLERLERGRAEPRR